MRPKTLAPWFGVLITATLLCFGLALFGCQKQKYPGGKDTVATFGDGRFQIGRFSAERCLFDAQTGDELARDIRDWREQGDDTVCLVEGETTGHGRYVVLNYKTGAVSYSPDLDKVPAQNRDTCRQLNKNGFRQN